MLYSLLAVVVLEAVMIPVVGLYCFRTGFNLSAREDKRPEIPPVVKGRPAPIGDEEARLGKLLANIETYDGTDTGQKEIV
jgi:hypothetical protein